MIEDDHREPAPSVAVALDFHPVERFLPQVVVPEVRVQVLHVYTDTLDVAQARVPQLLLSESQHRGLLALLNLNPRLPPTRYTRHAEEETGCD